ncbi:MAG TPA: FecR domain-containing protein [Caulobacteraceae bacterium]
MSALNPAREAAVAWCLRLAEGPLDPTEREAFDAWLAADPGHPALFDEAVALWSAAGDQAGAPEMVVLRGQALESARRANAGRWTRDGRPTWRFAAIAASVMVAVLAGVWTIGLPTTYRTGVGERELVALPDGSKLSLDADTAVTVRYTQGRRTLSLKKGRARFSVAKDPLRPFTVTSAGKTVVAVGTAFSVERLGRQVRVILYEGKVSVLDDPPLAAPRPLAIGPSRKTADVVLKPGGELVIGDTAPVARLATADVVRSQAWEGGQLVFRNEPLADAVARVNRYADHPIRLADAAAARLEISGVFTAGDTEAFVDGVTAVFPLRARQDGENTIISSDIPAASE